MKAIKKHTDKSIMITGASVTGKTTLCRRLMVHFELQPVPVHMTRKIRPGEIKNVDGIFVTEKKFKENFEKKKYLQASLKSTFFSGAYYGFPKEWLEYTLKNDYRCFVCPTVKMAKEIKKTLGKKIFWIHLSSTEEIRIERLLKRSPNMKKEHFETRIKVGSANVDTKGKDLNIDTSYLNAWEIFFNALTRI
ncbi:hypothetical protein C0580_01070 [Candidatus Parcubacteria bacterium]|nr:MAG: hypothetical protein C0580_01070 [Candidatus Parcubacteria bacterium]